MDPVGVDEELETACLELEIAERVSHATVPELREAAYDALGLDPRLQRLHGGVPRRRGAECRPQAALAAYRDAVQCEHVVVPADARVDGSPESRIHDPSQPAARFGSHESNAHADEQAPDESSS